MRYFLKFPEVCRNLRSAREMPPGMLHSFQDPLPEFVCRRLELDQGMAPLRMNMLPCLPSLRMLEPKAN